ncbi:hypothetical protein BPAE_0173g00090 [Botrytis paeoniae]|uniref:Uncharacterized protein n=1 Tax=Botrytis paeoniae TaxID=278948 RepID=A0A4Z1FG84_9HELO|nr:hypothetical protein BPAE_0173g00090 [Botrytis paeoniae]
MVRGRGWYSAGTLLTAIQVRKACLKNGLKNLGWNIADIESLGTVENYRLRAHQSTEVVRTLPWSHQIDDFVIFYNKGTENSNFRGEIVEFGSAPLSLRGKKTWLHGIHFNTARSNFQTGNVTQGAGPPFIDHLDDLDWRWWYDHELLGQETTMHAFEQGREARKAVNRVRLIYNVEKLEPTTILSGRLLSKCLDCLPDAVRVPILILLAPTSLAYGGYGYLKRMIKGITINHDYDFSGRIKLELNKGIAMHKASYLIYVYTANNRCWNRSPYRKVCIAHVTFSSTITIGYNMADIAGRHRRDPPHSRPGSLTLSEGRTQSLSGRTEVGRSFSSRDSADLSGTIQDPDERPAIRSQLFAGGLGGGGGPGLPGTGDGEIDLSGIGRPAQDTGQPSTKPAEADKDLNFMIPPAKPKPPPVDISQFKNPDGSYDMARIQAVLSTRVQIGVRETRAERRAQRARGSTVSVPAMKPLDTTQATTPMGRAEEVYPSQGGRSGGRGGQQRRPRGNLNLSPIAERSSMGSKEMENPESQKKAVFPGGGKDLETGKVDLDKVKQPTVEEDKADGSAAEEPVADDEGSLYGASPPRHPVQKPLPHDSNTSPGQREKYRRWATEPAETPTVEEKFKEWVDRGRSSESKTAAQELEAWAQNDLYDAREKHLAWLFEQRSAASHQLRIETEKSKILQLRNVIIRCTLSIKEAIKLEDKRQNRNTLRNNVELETNVLVKLRFQELLQELKREIELDEKVEQVKLQMHMRPDSVWKKALDMTPAERAALDIQAGHHFAAPAQQPPPMVLRGSFAEQLLRDKWEKEDAPEELEDLFDDIGGFSDSEERDTYWEAFQDIRRPILLQRNKELTDLWKEQADEVKADRQDAWLKSEAEAEKKLLKLRQLDKPNKEEEEEEAKKRQFADALAATVAKKKVEDAKVDKTIEDIEGVRDTPNVPPVAGQTKRMDISGLVAALRGKGVFLPEPPTQGGKDSGRKGLLSVHTAPKVAGDSGEAETAVTVNVSLAPRDSAETEPRTNSTEEEEKISLPEPRPGSPFRAENSLSSIQEQRSSLTFETDREIADFLEYMAMVRHNEEVVRTGEGELIDSELMREKEKTVMNPGPIDPVEEEKSQKRIQVAEKRLEFFFARLMMPKEELKVLEEKERKQRKMAKDKKDLEEAAAWEEAERLRKQELEDKETARGKAEAEEKEKKEERKRNEIAKENKAEKERKEREIREMAVRDQINKEREEKVKADQIARDKISKDLKDKEVKKKPDVPIDFAGDILTKIKNDLLAKAGGVNPSKPAGEVKPKQDNKDLDDYMEEVKRKLEEEERAWKENRGKGKGKPEENPPAETDDAQKARMQKENAEDAARRIDMVRKDHEDAQVRNEKALAKKKGAEAEAAKKKPVVAYFARDKAERLAREERERQTKERDRLAQERADELRNRPEPTAALREKKLAEERKAKAAQEAKEKRENERLEQEKRDEEDRLLDEEVDRLYNVLQHNKALQQKEEDRVEREERDQEEREKNEHLQKNEKDRVLHEEKELQQKDLEDTVRLKKLEEDRLARERITKKRRGKADSERLVRVENLQSEVQNPDRRKERKEREKKEKDKKNQEAAAAAAALVNRAAGGRLFQNLAGRINFPDLSWFNFRGPTHLQGRAGDVASNPPSPSIRTPVPADYELAPVDIAWMHAYAAESVARRKISLNLTIFSSAKQHLSGAAPPHYLVCHDIPVLWNVSQLKQHFSAIVRRAKVGERKIVRLRIERRWLKNGSNTLVEEGFRDWESVVVIMVEEGENVREGDWKECIREADGMAGWIEGWPGKGALRMPGDRKVWLAEASSLRTRVAKQSDIKEPSNLAQRSLRSLLKQPTAATGTVAPSSINTTAAASATADTAGTYRSIYPKLDPELIPSELSKRVAIPPATRSFTSFLLKKKTRLCKKTPRLSKQLPPSVLERQALSRSSSIADSTKKSAKAHDKQPTTTLATPFIPLPLTHNTSHNPDSQDEDKKPATQSRMAPKQSTGSSQDPSQNSNKRSHEKFEEPEEKNCMISCGLGGQLDDYATFYFTETVFEAILEIVPHFRKFRKPYSNSIYIRGYMASSSRVIIQWLIKGTIMPLELHKPGRAEGLSNYRFVDTYIMATDFHIPRLCDALMDLAMREFWGNDKQAVILPDIRDLYTVYSETDQGNPLRKLYIAVFDWLLTSDECNRDTGRPKVSSAELWNLLSRSENAGIDYIDYCRSQITDRGTYEHPLDPRKWNLCELHQHFSYQDCPIWIKRRNATLEDN